MGQAAIERFPIGIVGVGNMGGAIASALLGAGFEVLFYDIRTAAGDSLVGSGGVRVDSLADLASRTRYLAIVVVSDEQVREVGGTLLRHAQPGTTLVIHSTVRPSTVVELARAGEQLAVVVIDAAVSGGAEKAAQGKLTLMIGGAPGDVAACEAPFSAIGAIRLHVGPSGSGAVVKLLNNLLSIGGYALCLEAMELAAAYGLDEDTVAAVVVAGSGDCRQVRSWGRHDRARRQRRDAGVDWSYRMGRDLGEAAVAGGHVGCLCPLVAEVAEALPAKLQARDRALETRGLDREIPRCVECDYELAAPYREAGIHPECRPGGMLDLLTRALPGSASESE